MPAREAHWSAQKEKGGGYWQIKFLLWVYRHGGAGLLQALLVPIVAVFWLVSPAARRHSRQFLARAERQATLRPHEPASPSAPASSAPRSAKAEPAAEPRLDDSGERLLGMIPDGAGAAQAKPYRYRRGDVYRHLYGFAGTLVDKLAAWANDLSLANLEIASDGVAELVATLNSGSGAVVLCSHLGNMEVLRALGRLEVSKVLRNFAVNAIVDFSGTANFNRMLEEVNPDSMVRLVSANDMGPDTVILLQERLAAGELVTIAGDRTSARNPGRSIPVEFLGDPAWFPEGPFVLASLLEAPVFLMFGLRRRDGDRRSPYGFYVWRVEIPAGGGRRERQKKIAALAAEFVRHLEELCVRHPFQWYNFFDFWTEPKRPSVGDA